MSLIQWTDETWNPTTGCDHVSRECDFCYADKMSKQYQKQAIPGYSRGFNFSIQPQRLEKPKEWASGRYVFTGSMSDLFHKRCPDEYLFQVFEVMNEADQHVYQLLTKRPERYVEMAPHLPWNDHIWAGASVGHRDSKDRIDMLRESGADVTYISAEPLIEDLGEVDLTGIDWMIFGGESGPIDPDDPDDDGIRELDPRWILDLLEQCREQGTTPFVKQLGQIWADEHEASDTHGGYIFDWPKELQIREVPRIYPDQPDLSTLPGIVNGY